MTELHTESSGLVLVGGGDFALELYAYITADLDEGRLDGFYVRGVLDKKNSCLLTQRHPEIQYLGSTSEYIPEPNDKLLITVADCARRRDIYQRLEKYRVPFFSYAHPTAFIAKSAKVGEGVIVGPHCVVSAWSEVGNNAALNIHCGVGHGADVGSHSVMSPYSVINGDCRLGEAVFLGSRVTLNPKITIGDFTLIDAGSVLREHIPAFSIVSQRVKQTVMENRILKKRLDHN